ncbi:MAG: VWA domain-containing protein [Pyrinomonadaceae bacterium]
MFSSRRSYLVLSTVLASCLNFPTVSRSTTGEDALLIELAAGAGVRIENRFGNIEVVTWNDNHVSVSATIEGGPSKLTRSPIVIDNKGTFLAISVVRLPVDSTVGINLRVNVPVTSHVEARTIAGEILMRGISASAILQSKSGNITSLLPDSSDVRIDGRTTAGTIQSSFGTQPAGKEQTLQTQLGSGEHLLNAVTESGEIIFAIDHRDASTPTIADPNIKRGVGTPATNTDNQEVSEGDVIRVDSQLVTLNTSVIDRNTNRGLAGLTKSDFRLFEDGQEQNIAEFESSSAPFDLVLLIDLSGSTREVIKLIRASALRFVAAARPSDRIAVITFAGQPALVSGLTSDRELLRQRIKSIDTQRGDTKLYDATEFAMNRIQVDQKKSRRTAIIVMSDGLDGTLPGVSGQQGSHLQYRELLNHIQEFDGVVYSIWLNTEYEAFSPEDTQPEAFDAGHDRMNAMAEAGGGVFYEVEKLEDLAGVYERVVADLGTVYSITYRPSNNVRDGQWRSIKIVVSRLNAVARGKRGYYAN